MSQFFWQNALKNSNDGRQYSFDEKYQNDKNTNSQWSNIGLVENENDQRTTQYYPAEWVSRLGFLLESLIKFI